MKKTYDVKLNKEQAEIYREKGLWGDKTLLDYWKDAVSVRGDAVYVNDDLGKTMTYNEVDREADILASWMLKQGIQAGDSISIQCTPRAEFVTIVVACWKVGAVIVPIKMRTGSAEWARQAGMVKSRMHFSVDRYHNQDYIPYIMECESELDSDIINVFIREDSSDKGDGDHIWLEDILSHKNDSLQSGKPLEYKPDETADDVAAILYTSGTTAGSHGTLLSHNNIIFAEKSFIKMLKLDESDAMFMPSPLTHVVGFHHGIVAMMICGGKLVLMNTYEKNGAMEIMDREGCTLTMGATPFIYDYIQCMDEGAKKPSRMKFMLCGGAPVPGDLVRKGWNNYGISICEVYGSTESVPHVMVPPESAVEWNGEWSGIGVDGIEIRIVDEDGNDVAPGETGEEISRGPHIFLGYLYNPEDTKLAIDSDGWYHSGDLCYGDGKGRLRICGRIKDILVRGGENLNVIEIEQDISGYPGVKDCAVVGLPDPRLGERVCAFIVSEDPDNPVTMEALLAYLADNKVSKWHWPERIEHIDALPYTDSGKKQRYLVREELERRLKEESVKA